MDEIKIVFLDIDGTILNEDKQIPNSTKHAVFSLQEKGIHVVIATGRAPFMFEWIREELNIDSYVSFNGSYAVYDNQVVYAKPLEGEALFRLEQKAEQQHHPMVFLDEKEMKANDQDHSWINESMNESLKMEHPPYDATFHHARSIYQALLFCEPEHEGFYFGEEREFDFVRWHEKALDILPPSGSKAKGIEVFIERLGISSSEIVAFGDALNDIEMIKFAGTGVAMGNAMEEVKEVADIVTYDVNENGIYEGVVRIGLL
ncbi:Cof-type HAD-IIB family hydrolase [Texcoconibacillus texcoconensis]|uniref:Cof-type HAD-IIB family hydrolase n=1 Tax=Texcoconibacillus texcoconensis TaxID=1095777 RepID=A0A840QLJ7_9BACI|nr:Cof-type HAD-IIB family hydrolase [Texcoconibacillus texcoconensis]MBB5172245.1 hypothetical protein [Texcoconibacillus texcoconensis]